MKRISAYQATDGTIFNDKHACKIHQAQLDIVDGVKKIADRINDNPDYINDEGYYTLDSEELARFILENGADIKNALNGKPLKEEQ